MVTSLRQPPTLRTLHRFTSHSGYLAVFFFLGLFLVLLCAGGAPAAKAADGGKKQEKYALIFGTVWGPDDHPLYAVRVKIRRAEDKANKVRWEVFSDHNGEFAQRVPPGPADYLVWADLKDYKSPIGSQLQPGDETKVHLEGDERADISLHLK